MARKVRITTKVCTRTGFTITGTPDEIAEHFYRDKSQKDGFSPWSKDAERTYNKAYRDALKVAEVERKGDASGDAVVAFDNTMAKAGVRTSRGRASSNDGTRTPQAKKAAVTRRRARKAKAKATANAS